MAETTVEEERVLPLFEARPAPVVGGPAHRTGQPLGDLDAAIHDHLSVGRFVENIVWSVSSYSLEIPPDPDEAERELCR